jgi:4-hydroxy-tetrahydrodipicolinate synthase
MIFSGLMTALVTPFKDGAVDESTFRALVRRQIEGGVQGLVPCGTTGEAPTLTVDEQLSIVQWTLEEANGAVPVMAGIGSNSTAKAVEMGRRVEALGVQGVLATAPYYNKPTQEGLFQHFQAIAEAVSVGVCLYDVPGRSVVHIAPRTVARLAPIDNIIALKDATGDLANATDVRRRCGSALALLSGDDFTSMAFLAQGGNGVISVASNVCPVQMRDLVDAAVQGQLERAQSLNEQLFPLFRDLFIESNPIPVKAAMAHMGLLEDGLRLPLTPMSEALRGGLFDTVDGLGL